MLQNIGGDYMCKKRNLLKAIKFIENVIKKSDTSDNMDIYRLSKIIKHKLNHPSS